MTDRLHPLPVSRLSVHLQWPTRTLFAQNQTTSGNFPCEDCPDDV